MEKEYYKSKEVEKILGISPAMLRYMRNTGRIPFEKVGEKTFIYQKSDIDQIGKYGFVKDEKLKFIDLIKESNFSEKIKSELLTILNRVDEN